MGQINDTNKMLKPVKVFLVAKNFQQTITFYLYHYFILSFLAMLLDSFPLFLIYHTGLLQF